MDETPADHGAWPGVSVIIPVAGDARGPGRWPAVSSMERQRYPGPLEVIVVSAREVADDPGLPPEATGKVRNLSAGVRRARYPVLLFCDADVEAPSGLVRDLVRALSEPGTGLAYALPCWTGGQSLPALFLEAWANAQVGTFLLPATRLASRLPVTGAVVALPRAVLGQVGGVAALAGYLADDARLGELVQAAGYRAAPRGWVHVRTGDPAWSECLGAVLRWLLTLRHHTPVAYAVSYLTHWVAAALVWGAAVEVRGGSPGQAWLPLVLVALLRILLSALPPLRAGARGVWPAVLTPLADLLAVPLWPVPLFARRITWAGTTYLVLKGGRVKPAPGPLPGRLG
ncbi:MAG: glycosyltransferase [Firmicutes bacterium]|nr:glycosyltransferase [Bacillota bacterium]